MIKLNISDLLVQAVDDAGRPLGAVFSVEGPTAETTISELYSLSDLLNLSQLPIAEYRVKGPQPLKTLLEADLRDLRYSNPADLTRSFSRCTR